jgi:hypothetical protein
MKAHMTIKRRQSHRRRQAIDLLVGGGEIVRHLRRVRPFDRGFQAELHAGERSPQLVRGVRDELPLGVDRAFDAVGHLVERASQLLDLIGAGDVVCARGEITSSQPSRGPGEFREGSREGTGHDDRDHQSDGEPDPADDGDQADRRSADRVVHALDVLRDANRPDQTRIQDRRGGEQCVGSFGVAVADLGVRRGLVGLQSLLHPQLFSEWNAQIELMQSNGERNIMEDLVIEDVRLVEAQNYRDDEKDIFAACIDAAATDYTIGKNGEIVSSNTGSRRKQANKEKSQETFREFWTYERHEEKWLLLRIDQSNAWKKSVDAELINEK